MVWGANWLRKRKGMHAVEITELRCKSCGAPLASENVVEHLAMARCSHCGAVMALEGMAGWPAKHSGEPKSRPPVPMPLGIRVTHPSGQLEISRRWYSHGLWFLAFFCVFWNGFMVVWHWLALSQGAWFMSVFGLLHTAVGIGILYVTLAGFLNTTVIRVRYGELSIQSGPIPFPGNTTLRADEIEQLYAKERRAHSNNGDSYRYEVHAVKRDGHQQLLLKGLNEVEQALFIEQQLEQFLGIKDRPVPGEIAR